MSGDDKASPTEIYRRDDPDVDPPAIALGRDIERRLAEGETVLFLDDEPDPARSFELHRLRGAFRLSDGIAPTCGCFASAQAAIRDGWAMLDGLAPNPFDQFDAELPPIGALIGSSDPTEEGP